MVAMMSSNKALTNVPTPVTSTVPSFDGTLIHYDVYDAPSRSTVLVVPGFWRDRRHPAMVRLAGLLTSNGYRTAVIDVRGHGDSEGTYGFNYQEHHDVAAVANDILQSVSAESITLVGFSYGGAIAISTAARHEFPVAAVLLVSPVADFSMIVPRINPFTIHRHIAFSQALKRPRFAWRMRRSVKLRAVDDIGNVHAPVCFIHVKNDWLIAHRHSIALYEKANEPKELHILDLAGNYHADRIFSVASESVEPIISSFLERFSPR
jgi:pimeloyl-ACP methyl ester carboxylesterase